MVEEVQNNENKNSGQTERKSNGIGTAGFVLALIGLFTAWIPVVGWIIWLLGMIFSFIGVFRSPRGLSIAGLIISFCALIIIIVIWVIAMSSASYYY